MKNSWTAEFGCISLVLTSSNWIFRTFWKRNRALTDGMGWSLSAIFPLCTLCSSGWCVSPHPVSIRTLVSNQNMHFDPSLPHPGISLTISQPHPLRGHKTAGLSVSTEDGERTLVSPPSRMVSSLSLVNSIDLCTQNQLLKFWWQRIVDWFL